MLSAVALTACSSDEPLPAPAPALAADGVAASRSVSDAEAIAIALAEGRQGESRFGEQVFVDGVVALTESNSRGGSDTLLYAVNYADNKGFVLVAAPLAAEPIIGFTEQGSFDETEAAENPGFAFYLDAAKNYASTKVSIGGGGITIDPSRPIETTEVIRPRICVAWGQSYPEGMYCPNGISGCGQTAMVQMMTYLQKPTSIQYTYSGRDINSENLNWAALCQHEQSINVTSFTNNSTIISHLGSCASSEDKHKTIARICRQLGEMNAAKYDNGSSVKIEAVERTFRALLPQNTISQQIAFSSNNYNNIYNYIASHQSVAYVRGEIEGTTTAHAWVCDGGKCIKVTQTLTLAGGGTETIEISRKNYFHFNWGWCGAHNGYFHAGVFDPENPSRSTSIGNFNYWVYLIHVVK